MLDSLKAAHDAGYVHGLIVGGLAFGFVGAVFGAGLIALFIAQEDPAPDPDANCVREDRRQTRDELPPTHPHLEIDE